jgi:hypothetical protein
MKKYLITSKKYGDLVRVEYKDGELQSVHFYEVIAQQKFFVLQMLMGGNRDFAEENLDNLLKQIKTKDSSAERLQLLEELPFDLFWDEYGFKVGKKERVKKKWDAMEYNEKAKAMAHIRKYKFFLAERPHIQQKYPETYLGNAEWNN